MLRDRQACLIVGQSNLAIIETATCSASIEVFPKPTEDHHLVVSAPTLLHALGGLAALRSDPA